MDLPANSRMWRIRVQMTSPPAPLTKPPLTKQYLWRRRSCGGNNSLVLEVRIDLMLILATS
jgi:hypothetical protein